MNILVVCQYYYPENFQITPICEEMSKKGNLVTVLTGLPNYPSGIVPKEYKKGHRDEIINGVRVLRVNEIGRKKGPLFLALNYLSFWKNANKAINKISGEYDLVFLYQLSPVLMGLPALKYKKKHNVPIVTYVCDLWPEALKMYIHNEKNLIYKWAKKISFDVYSKSDKLLCQSFSFERYLIDYHRICKDKITYFPAFADDSYLEQDFKYDNGIIDFVFLGNIGIAQNLIRVLEAFERIKNLPGFMVHIVGDGACLSELKRYVHDNNMETKIIFYGRKPVEEMPIFYKIADVCLVSLKADSEVGLTLPSKVQGYMAAGKPILGMIEGSTEFVVKDANCGICVKSDDVDAFVANLLGIIKGTIKLDEFSSNARDYFKKHFTKKHFIEELTLLFNKVVYKN